MISFSQNDLETATVYSIKYFFLQYFELITPITVPANETLWVGGENQNASFSLKYNTGVAGSQRRDTHTYGLGDDPFDEVTSNTVDLEMGVASAR